MIVNSKAFKFVYYSHRQNFGPICPRETRGHPGLQSGVQNLDSRVREKARESLRVNPVNHRGLGII